MDQPDIVRVMAEDRTEVREGDSTSDSARLTRFRSLYDCTLSRTSTFVRRAMAADFTNVEDVVAEVYLVAWRRLDDVPSPPEDQLWLFGVANKVIANHRRSVIRRSRLQTRLDQEPPGLAPQAEPDDEVRAALRSLPRRERDALNLVIWEGLTSEEAARVAGCSPNAIRSRVHRAKHRLRTRLAIEEPTESQDLPAADLAWELPQ